jgi:predicted small lipoprotein YifL
MPSLNQGFLCSACGKKHDLYLPDADMYDGNRDYQYVCPEKGDTVTFRPPLRWDKVVSGQPTGSVIANLAKK